MASTKEAHPPVRTSAMVCTGASKFRITSPANRGNWNFKSLTYGKCSRQFGINFGSGPVSVKAKKCHRNIGLAPQTVAEFPFHHGERGFDVRPMQYRRVQKNEEERRTVAGRNKLTSLFGNEESYLQKTLNVPTRICASRKEGVYNSATDPSVNPVLSTLGLRRGVYTPCVSTKRILPC
jgi:hypothetical protein